MKYLFVVQGEGRGHMTQAISLYKMLTKNGHAVCHVVVGKSRRRVLPDFFLNEIDAPITQLESPNFLTDKKSKSVKIFKSVIFNLLKLGVFLKSIHSIHQVVKAEEPDAVINFYDFLGGLYFMFHRNQLAHVAIAHQFLVDHPEFDFPKGRLLDKASLKVGNRLAGFGAKKILALSFQKFEDFPKKKLTTVPPLLREEIKMQSAKEGNYFLVYMVNHGYAEQVEQFHKQHPEITIHCFWDKKDMPEIYQATKNLTFHQLDDKKFINFMAGCKGYLTTAGFESVCEAMYLGKPTLMVPVTGHYEQACNALDAKKAGAGISSEIFNLQVLLDYLPVYKPVQKKFHVWCDQTEQFFMQNLTQDVN